MKPRLLQNARFTAETEASLNEEFDIHPLWREPEADAFLARHGGEFVGLVTTGGIGADAKLIDRMPALKLIASRGVGFDKIDLDAAKRRGVAVSNTPGVLTDCVADYALALLLCAARKLCEADRFVRNGNWHKGRFPMATRVHGKQLGIVGLGRIGRTLAKRASGCDMQIRYHDVQPFPELAYTFESSLVELAGWADFLVVTAAGGAGTRKMVSAEVLAALGPQGYLVNVSCGSLVDEVALVDALVHKRLAGAALDVFEDEPNVPAALLPLDNVALFPHIASSTDETFKAMEDLVLDNVRSYFANGRLLTPIA
jgi:lactate dehydrogenase-like 2-hydroxyacid dehydrogenase